MTSEIGFVALMRRWWWLFALGALAAGLAAYAFAQLQRPTYASTATLLVGPLNTDYTTTRVAGDLGRTYAEVAESLPVLEAALARTDAALAATELGDDVTATSNDVTRLVTLEVNSTSPQLAASLANALAEQMIQVSQTVAPTETDAIRDFMGQREVERLSVAEQDALRNAAVRVFGAGLTGRLRVIDPAVRESDPVAPKVELLTTLGVLAGLALTAVVVLIMPPGDGRRRSDAESAAELAGIPSLGTVDGTFDGALAGEQGAVRAAAEYRLLAERLLGGRRIRSLAVVGAGDSQAAGVVAAHLASVAASDDGRVLLVDAGCGAVTKLLGVAGRAGVAELLREPPARTEALLELRVPRGERLGIVPVGETAESSLLEHDRARRLLAGWEQLADVVVLSAPPVDGRPLGLVWAAVADATLIVGDGSSRGGIRAAASSLEAAGARVLGSVNGRSSRSRMPRLLPWRGNEQEAA